MARPRRQGYRYRLGLVIVIQGAGQGDGCAVVAAKRTIARCHDGAVAVGRGLAP